MIKGLEKSWKLILYNFIEAVNRIIALKYKLQNENVYNNVYYYTLIKYALTVVIIIIFNNSQIFEVEFWGTRVPSIIIITLQFWQLEFIDFYTF